MNTIARRIAIFILLLFPLTLNAQDDEPPVPDYRVSTTSSPVTITDTEIVISVVVYNSGGDATTQTTLELSDIRRGDVLTSETLVPIDSGSNTPIELRLDVAQFEPGEELTLWVTVDSDNLNDEVNATLFNNNATLPLITIPQSTTSSDSDDDSPTSTSETDTNSIITIPILETEIDTSDRDQMLIVAGILASILIITIILLLIVRTLTRRAPPFGNWQPPYATMPPMDPNSTFGRRQMWQQHAQNNTLPPPSSEHSVFARKLLMGMDGYYLSGWKFAALRLTQYDMYGRVSRSEVLAQKSQLKRLNAIARKADTYSAEQIRKRVKGISKRLAKEIRSKIRKRSALLPIALDVRLNGTHGEGRIIFELYQQAAQGFQQIDQWEPEMTVVSHTIHETYTFTISGQTPTETYNQFKKRLADDFAGALTVLFLPQVPGTTEVMTSSNTQPVAINTETPM